ncbi:MAG: hypothetical protein N2484_00255 [Clostridia bacterium]|nr:hypothetical protein [Clostridia bacterium]
MSLMPNQNGNYSFSTNSILFTEGQSNASLNILLKGKVDVFVSPFDSHGKDDEDVLKRSFKVFELDQNIILGSGDLFLSKKHSFTYRTSKDSTLFIFLSPSLDQIKNLFEHQKDYAAYTISSIANTVISAYTAWTKLDSFVKTLRILHDNLLVAFWYQKEKQNFSHIPANSFFIEGQQYLEKLKCENFAFPLGFNSSFLEKKHLNYDDQNKNSELEKCSEKVNYYKHFLSISPEIRKGFFAADFTVTSYHCKEAGKCLEEIRSAIQKSLLEADRLFKNLYSDSEECILKEYEKAAAELRSMNADTSTVVQLIVFLVQKLREISKIFSSRYEHSYDIDFEYLDNMVNMLSMTTTDVSIEGAALGEASSEAACSGDYLPDELRNSAEKILEYSEIPKERADIFRISLEAFRNLKDRNSLSEEARSIRSGVSSVFFEIYEAVFKKVLKENNQSRLLNMFLTYAYMDEQLLETRHIVELYKQAGKTGFNPQLSTFSMKNWLLEIVNMRRNPSVNEFGQDYFDIFREMKKRGEISEKEKEAYDQNTEARLKHEVSNFFRTNHRVCHGQTSIYFPILHNDMISRDLSKALVTPEMVNDRINRILEVDFSAFHREIFYANPQKGIEKETIMKKIVPDIILMPIFGSRAIMWQEITGRSRNTPGRLVLPMFTAENLDDLLLKLIGNFRWELCRTMMGTAWNDITQSSLTSDYTDYIQFFKKNKDLSDEAKEKIKAQIQKYNNRLREIFTADYEVWINYESKGILRLNKVVRSILYKHCPFPKSIRLSLEKQPAFSDISIQFNNLRAKKAKEIENRYTMLKRSGIVLDPEMEENLGFYKEL